MLGVPTNKDSYHTGDMGGMPSSTLPPGSRAWVGAKDREHREAQQSQFNRQFNAPRSSTSVAVLDSSEWKVLGWTEEVAGTFPLSYGLKFTEWLMHNGWKFSLPCATLSGLFTFVFTGTVSAWLLLLLKLPADGSAYTGNSIPVEWAYYFGAAFGLSFPYLGGVVFGLMVYSISFTLAFAFWVLRIVVVVALFSALVYLVTEFIPKLF
jgi:hypothetical protein